MAVAAAGEPSGRSITLCYHKPENSTSKPQYFEFPCAVRPCGARGLAGDADLSALLDEGRIHPFGTW